MPRTSPESVFAAAQEAMERGDWEAFFECLDRSDLVRLARMAVPVSGDAGDELAALCVEYGVPADALGNVESCARAVRESAQALRGWRPEPGSPASPASLLNQQSLRHRDLVKALQKAVDNCLKSVPSLAAFTARAERLRRAKTGGGSVSSTLFVGDRLVDVKIEGTKASGTRRMKGGWEEPVSFVQRRGLWYVKFLPKERSAAR